MLVLAPHPDDEAIGCGGALLKHFKNEDQVKILYLTDGSLGFKDGFKPSTAEKKQMAIAREEEAKKLQNFGQADQVFLRYPDSRLSLTNSLINYLTQELKSFHPDVIYTPYLLDTLNDHNITSVALGICLEKAEVDSEVWQYEVWSPGFCNTYLNIDDVQSKKMELIKIYKSQLKSRDFTKAAEGLSAYRAMIFGKSKYAEAYLKTDSKLFKKLIDLLD